MKRLAITFTLLCFAIGCGQRQAELPDNLPSVAKSHNSLVSLDTEMPLVSALELHAFCEQNKVLALKQFKDRPIIVSGIVDDIDFASDGYFRVSLKTGNTFDLIYCLIDPSGESAVHSRQASMFLSPGCFTLAEWTQKLGGAALSN